MATLSDDPHSDSVYTPSRAGALAGVSGQTIGQWARNGFIQPNIYEGRPINLYSFRDVAEAVAVKWLLDERFSYEEIRTAIAQAREEHGNWPLTEAPLGIVRQSAEGDRGVIAQREGPVYVNVSGPRRKGQVTLRPEFWFNVRDTLRRGGWIAKQLKLRRIEVTPES